MEEGHIGWVLAIARGSSSLTAFCLILVFAGGSRRKQLILRAYEEFSGMVKTRWNHTGYYHRLHHFLDCNGAKFHYGRGINPVRYLVICLLSGVGGMVIGSSFHAGYGIMLMILLFYLPGMLLVYLNKRDNERLLPELKLVYYALTIQIKAGVYVADALAECYGSVQEKRLREALLELSGDIALKSDLLYALNRFQEKFDNRYVDSLCITILQAMESGQAVELLADIAEQIKDMEAAMLQKKKSSLDRSLTFYQLVILAAILVVVLYACLTHMFMAAVHF